MTNDGRADRQPSDDTVAPDGDVTSPFLRAQPAGQVGADTPDQERRPMDDPDRMDEDPESEPDPMAGDDVVRVRPQP